LVFGDKVKLARFRRADLVSPKPSYSEAKAERVGFPSISLRVNFSSHQLTYLINPRTEVLSLPKGGAWLIYGEHNRTTMLERIIKKPLLLFP